MEGDAATLAEAWEFRLLALREGLTVANQRIGERALKLSLELMEKEIYAHPIPRSFGKSKRGRAKWRRTGRLRRGEKLKIKPLPDLAAVLINRVPYAAARHEMGKPGAKRRCRWPAHWRDDTVKAMRRYQVQGYTRVVRQSFGATAGGP